MIDGIIDRPRQKMPRKSPDSLLLVQYNEKHTPLAGTTDGSLVMQPTGDTGAGRVAYSGG